MQHHFLDDFPQDAIFSHFFGCVPEETLATPHRSFFDRSKISRIKALLLLNETRNSIKILAETVALLVYLL